MKESFYDYAMTTITSRALPDVKDGLKPVHRRILFGMSQLKMTHNKPHKKSARIVGDILGKYHPHGDSSVYEAMVRMSQDFSLMIPLVDGHGNFGSIDGDGAAAMRYTEARLSLAGETMTMDLEKGLVDFVPNYDDSEKEPTVLPARFPNLLINGSEGIATGMATNIPTHNPNEVVDAWRYMVQYGSRANEETLLKKLCAPDYPMGGVITNANDLRSFYQTGYGKVVMRAKHHVEEEKGIVKRIVFTELPNKSIGTKNNLINQLIELVNDQTLNEVTDVVDESSRDGIRLVLDIKKGTNVNRLLDKLWLKTNLQSSDRMQFLVLVDGQPQTISLMQYFEHYIAFQKDLQRKKHSYLSDVVKDRLEIVKGFLEAHRVLDVVIDAIRHAETHQAILNCLIKGDTSHIDWRLKKHAKIAKDFAFTPRQAEAILNRRLRSLTALDEQALLKEEASLNKAYAYHQKVLTNANALKKELLGDVDVFKKQYATDRRSTLTNQKVDVDAIEERLAKRVQIHIDDNGYVISKSKNGKAPEGALLATEASVTDTLAVFTSFGNLYQVKVDDVSSDKKIPIQVLAQMQPGEKFLYIGLGSAFEETEWFVLSKLGKGKRIAGTDLMTKGFRSKTYYTKLDTKKNDEIVLCTPKLPEQWLVVETNLNRGGRIDLTDESVPYKTYGKAAKGSTLVKMKKGEYLSFIATPEAQTEIVNGTQTQQWTDVTGVTVKPLDA